MNPKLTIALDAMGGDHAPEVVVEGAVIARRRFPDVHFLMFGDEARIKPLLDSHAKVAANCTIHHTDVVVRAEEKPSVALRQGRKSSMQLAIDAVHGGAASGVVSAGNTGALMAMAKVTLRTLPGIDRPAIIATMPAIGGHTHMLDLGANSHCTAMQLFQFGVMGSVVSADFHELEAPRVGLLNIGVEAIKGTEIVREAGRMLSRSNLNYVGFVEANDIFTGQVDVVVSDGFAGNVALKTLEGAARMISSYMRAEFTRTLFSRIQGLVALPVLKAFRKKMDPRRYNGASLVGLNGIVVKSHGGADRIAFGIAIQTALVECQQGVPTQISNLLEQQAI